MSDVALESQGMTIDIGDTGSPPAFVNIVEVRSIQGPDGQANWMDTTDLNSTAKEGRPGLRDEGQIRLRLFWVPDATSHLSLRSAFTARTKKAFRLTFTDTAPVTIWEFDAYVLGLQIGADVDNPLMADVSLRISDAIRVVQ